MKNITKGAIAAGAAAVLLLGGAGTFMEWNQEDTLDGVAIDSGLLTLDTTGDATWTLNGTAVDISEVQIVPGDVLKFVQPVAIAAEGDNIQGVLSIEDGSISAANEDVASEQLATALTEKANFELATEDTGLNGPDESGTFSFDGGGNYTADLVVGLDFGENSVSGLAAQSGKVNLEGIKVAVTQTVAAES